MSGLKPESVIRAVNVVMDQATQPNRSFAQVSDYEADNVSRKVLRIILSYTEYVNRTVWNK